MNWSTRELYYTAEYGDAWFMKQWVPMLTEEEINHCRTNQDRNTALIVAAKHGHLECVRILLSHPHIDTSIQNKYKQTAIGLAEKAGHKRVVEAILSHVARPVPRVEELFPSKARTLLNF